MFSTRTHEPKKLLGVEKKLKDLRRGRNLPRGCFRRELAVLYGNSPAASLACAHLRKKKKKPPKLKKFVKKNRYVILIFFFFFFGTIKKFVNPTSRQQRQSGRKKKKKLQKTLKSDRIILIYNLVMIL